MLHSKKLLTVGGFLSFFAFGFIDNLKGPLLPELLRSGQYTYSQGGTIVLAAYVGFILATLVTGVMADVISNRSVLLLAGVCLCVGSLGIGTTHSYPALIALMGVIGLGLGAIELGANGLMVELHRENRGRYLNLLSTCHGIGSLLVPLYAAALIDLGSTWQQVYFSSIFLGLPLLILFWPSRGVALAMPVALLRSLVRSRPQAHSNGEPFSKSSGSGQMGWHWKALPGLLTLQLRSRRHWHSQCHTQQFPTPKSAGEALTDTRWNWAALLRMGFSRQMNLYYVLIAAYVAVELSVAAWLMEFLQQDRSMTVATSSLYLSTFFILLMLGRLLGAFVVEHLNYITAVFFALAGAAACIAGGLFGPDALVVLLPLSGFFMSIVFPTVTAAVSKLHMEKTGTILGILFACGGLGGALGLWIVGVASEAAGLKLGLASTLLCALVAVSVLPFLRERTASSDQQSAAGR
ncbi:MAG: MFS transporter [Aureliella sp.]